MSILDNSKDLSLDELIKESNYKSLPIPIIKSPQSIYNSLLSNSFDNIYYFKLIINVNGKDKIFFNNESKKYSNLINHFHKIKFSELNYFKIIVHSLENTFKLEGDINHSNSYYVNKSDNLFIEFTQDYNNYVNCTCYFINSDLSMLCISPP